MQEIINKIAKLFDQSVFLTDYKATDWIKRHNQAIKEMTVLMDELKALAKANNTLVGRVISLPHADGNALYVVTKLTKKTAYLDWLPWIDNWQDDVLEGGRSMPLEWVSKKIEGQDYLEKMFPPRPWNMEIPEL